MRTVNFVPEKGWRPYQAHSCTVFYELYANLHRILRGLRKFAACFMSFAQICTVFYEPDASLHRILRALRKFASYFLSFTQICAVFYELYTNLLDLHRVLRALRKFVLCFTNFTQTMSEFSEKSRNLRWPTEFRRVAKTIQQNGPRKLILGCFGASLGWGSGLRFQNGPKSHNTQQIHVKPIKYEANP